MTTPDPVTVARRWLTLWQGAPLDEVERILAPDYVDHAPAGRSPDRAGVRQGLAALYAAFPDFHGVEEQLVAGSPPDLVAVTWTATGTHQGPFMGHAPTGRTVTFRGIEMIRVRDDLVIERWGEWDGEGLAAQLAAPVAAGTRHVLTILAVDDLASACTFYETALGWLRVVDVPVYVELLAPDGPRVGLYRREGFALNTGVPAAPAPSPPATTATELYLHTGDPDLVEARLRALGAPLLSPRAPRGWGDEASYWSDPAGNVVVVARPL